MNTTRNMGSERVRDWLDVIKMWAVLWAVAGSVVAMVSPLTSILTDIAP